MGTKGRTARTALALLALAGSASAQDSVATSPGGNDSLLAYDPELQRERFVLDLVAVETSWGNFIAVGPVLKASRDLDPMFNTQVLAASAISARHLAPNGGVAAVASSFPLWNSPGEGIHPSANSGAGSPLNVPNFDRRFCVAISDTGAAPTNVVGALVGQDADTPTRLYVDRINALTTRFVEDGGDSATVSLGSVDERANVYARADDFTASPSFAVRIRGENLLRVDLLARDTNPASAEALNILVNFFTPENSAFDAGSTFFLVNNGTVTLNTPVGLFDDSNANSALHSWQTVGLDFERRLLTGREVPFLAQTTSHMAPGLVGQRGNPSFSPTTASGGALGTVASLAVASGERANSINVFGLNPSPTPPLAPIVAPGSQKAAILPVPITSALGFTANDADAAEFRHFLSQVSFRGPSGQVGIGSDGAGQLMVAATARDPLKGDFVGVATFPSGGGSPTWTIAAHAGMEVYDGPNGLPVGTLTGGGAAAISSPGLDLLGNVYFVSRWVPLDGPNAGSTQAGLFKAVLTPSGYQLERLLSTGEVIHGANSDTDYEVVSLSLADSDSVASGGFHQGQVLQSMLPGEETTEEASIFALGGAIVNATISYQRPGNIAEEYEVALFVGPAASPAPPCPGDLNGDMVVNFGDLNILLDDFNTSGTGLPGDIDDDGDVDFSDLNILLGAMNTACPT